MKIDLTISERNLILDCLEDTKTILELKEQKEELKYYNSIKRIKIKMEKSLK